jgi:hypothetical protein
MGRKTLLPLPFDSFKNPDILGAKTNKHSSTLGQRW